MSVRRVSGDPSRLVVVGRLDDVAAKSLTEAVRNIARDWPAGVELDMRAVTAHTPAGAAAISYCVSVCRALERGVELRVATDAGRQALLDSMALV